MHIGFFRLSRIAALASVLSVGAGWAQERSSTALPSILPARKDAPRDKGKPSTTAENPHRQMEIQVELAWLADPVTFPYYLEAKMVGGKMEVRGLLPSKSVQEHAVRLARLNCSLPIADLTRENTVLTVRPTRLPPEKLQGAVHTALQQALPASHKKLNVECATDGRVVVAGGVASLEEKLAVSQSLRRLHGCGYVVNLTEVGGRAAPATTPVVASDKGDKTVAKSPAKMPLKRDAESFPEILPVQAKDPARMPAATAPPVKEGPFGGFFQKLFGKKTPPAPPAPKDPLPKFTNKEPVKITNIGDPLPKGTGVPPKGVGAADPNEAAGVIVIPSGDGAPKKKGKTLTPPQVKTRLESLFPKSRPINVTSEGGNKLKVEIGARTDEEVNNIIGRLLSLPELESYDVTPVIRMEGPPAKEGR